jgi:hypothetical protein
MYQREFMTLIAANTNEQLTNKLMLGGILVRGLQNSRNPKDQESAKRLQMEMRWIREEKARRKQNGWKPPPQVIQLNTLDLRSEIDKEPRPPAQVVKLNTLDATVKDPKIWRIR